MRILKRCPQTVVEPELGRPVGGTEQSWCRSVPGGTGIAVLAILVSKLPQISTFENSLRKLQNSHPILRSRLQSNTNTNTFGLVTSPTPFIKVKEFNLPSTMDIIEKSLSSSSSSDPQNRFLINVVSPFHLILEHELNQNAWCINRKDVEPTCNNMIRDMLFASCYALPDAKWVAVLRLHATACDRTTAVSLLKELLASVGEEEGGIVRTEIGNNIIKGEVSLAIEDLIPHGKAKKAFWTRGVDMLAYSVNSLRLTNLKFLDAKSPRSSQVVRLQLNQNTTQKLIAGCKARGIKLCGALASAGMIAAHSSKSRVDKPRKYGLVTLIDCRSILEPPLSNHHFGFYHSAVLNTHVVKGGEKLWELAHKAYMTFANYKNCNRHFSDMADLNFLMCKAIDNPSLTPSSAIRSSVVSVFEDTVIDDTTDDKTKKQVGLEDYMGCASVHGIGPSIAIFDTIRDGKLDCYKDLCCLPSNNNNYSRVLEMSNHEEDQEEVRVRAVGGTEYSWCRAVPGGTGVTVLVLSLSKPPNIPLIQFSLHHLRLSHPILGSRLRFTAATNTFSFLTPPSPSPLQLHPFDLSSTAEILSNKSSPGVDACHLILEHELNTNPWASPATNPDSDDEADVFFARVYTVSDGRWAVVLRLHTGACDRAAAVGLLRELLGLVGAGEGAVAEKENRGEVEVSLGIEELVPSEKANKPFWARGLDMLGYSLNSFRLSNLEYLDASSPRSSQVVRLLLDAHHTQTILDHCKLKGIKLSGVLAAAGLIAAHGSKNLPIPHREKYAVVTLVDCRSILEPVLNSHHAGFYHSAILNTHDITGGEELWELASRTHNAFANAKQNNKHFTDMSDLNFLMCKAIENPGLTPSGALRTAFISVFEDPVIDHSNPVHEELGLDDYLGCASVHGVGPSIAIFDTIRNRRLDCACVYPSPLHSRQQMQKLIDDMKSILMADSQPNNALLHI
ncbi:hypothetical protein Tsubulata_001342 [Turnera subulata]|uniref:Phthiocerol/phthiodiolone dimycocerosyl transferase C-terminal domain-containing protein n=1 Tax=Turnera subulata TaxID=218843 RepID=A0A9Q0FEV2_9ROSI|nr:hypothetical protein Tsubulata_001342 [Turnera subulata]